MSWHQNMTGRWVGHYDHLGGPHPIVGEFQQDGRRIEGTMTDEHLELDLPLDVALAAAGWRPGSEVYVAGLLRRRFPEMPEGPIRSRTTLPAHSTVRGRVVGSLVRFRKVYEGETVSGLRVGDWWQEERRRSRPIDYEGRLSDDESSLAGTWSIRAPGLAGLLGRRLASGRFVLRRA